MSLTPTQRPQAALTALAAIAAKHQTRIETVALRWQIDAGTFPLATTRWGPRVWRQFGALGWASHARSGGSPGVGSALFQVESFLDAQDVQALGALGVRV